MGGKSVIDIWNYTMIFSGLKRKIRGFLFSVHWLYKTANTKKLQNTNIEGGEKKIIIIKQQSDLGRG